MGYDPQSFRGLVDARTVLPPLLDREGRVVAEVAVGDPEEKLLAYCDMYLRMRGLERSSSEQLLRPRVDHGRWLADCPVCSGMDAALAVPGFEFATCLGCGTSYRVVFPDKRELETAYEALAVRPVSLRNWNPAQEPADSLRAENAGHGLPA